MAYSLDTLSGKNAPANPGSPISRGLRDASLLLGLMALLYWLLALLTHSPADPAWSTSGKAVPATGAAGAAAVGVANWGGRLGAWLSDLSFYLLG
jgi:DNA segregation ATPase FtsK/SpoIIIE, S-DNA-T family